MDQINSFEGGLNTDSAPERQDKNTYRYLLNGVDTSDTGDLLKITSEKGTTTFSGLMVDEGWKCIGDETLNNDIFLFFVKGNKGDVDYGCRIGIVDYLGNYTTKIDSIELNFNINWSIQAESKITFNNHRVIYLVDNNNPNRRIDLDSTEPFTIAEASLTANTSLPIVKFLTFNDGNAGLLYAGSYQFIARYLNDDLSSSSFGILSNPIPVIEDLRTVGRNGYDGATYETPINNKTIQLEISNLDTNKNLIEIIAIRYSGIAQTAITKRFYRGNFSGTTLEVEFTGLEDLLDVTLEEILIEPSAYISAKTITQKDNRIILSNLKGRKDGDFQLIANNIVVTYDVEEEIYQQDNTQYFDDYKGEMQTFDKKTYMSEEVYALALQGVYNDGTKTLAYHIPATSPDNSWKSADNYATTLPVGYNPTASSLSQKWYPSNFNTQTDGIGNKTNLQLGTYISQLKYEPNKDYPSTGMNDGNGVFIRHHLIPPLDIEPHFRNVGNVQYIRYKSLRFSVPDFSILPEADTKDLVGYLILRADRDLNNRSIQSQGLLQRTIPQTSVDLGNDTTPYPFGDTFYTEVPGFSNITVDTDGSLESSSYYVENGAGFIAAHNFHPQGSDATLYKWQMPSSLFTNDLVTYYSPDFILGNVGLSPSSFKEKLLIRGNVITTKYQIHTASQDDQANTTSVNQHGFDFFCDYDEKVGATNNKFDTVGQFYYYNNINQDLESTFNIPFGGNTRKVYEHFNTSHYLMRVNGGSLYQDSNYIDIFFRINNKPFGFDTHDRLASTITSVDITNTKALINVQKQISQQYGTLGNLEYLPIAFIPNKAEIPVEFDGGNNQLRIYNGDIFISKFFVKNSSLVEIQAWTLNGSNILLERTKDNVDNFPPYKGVPIQAGSYFFVESVVNTNYRHQVAATPPSTTTGVPYYPKYDAGTSLNTDPRFGNSNGYNLTYSKSNNLKTVPERPFGFVSVPNYPNRIIYSQQAIESEQIDAYRIFLANNFHDIPKNKGSINNIFVWGSILYAHTAKALWRNYMNENTLITGGFDSPNIYVGGDSRVFSQIATEVLTLAGGFGGSVSRFGGVATPSGYVFLDQLQGKLFKLNQGLEEISTNGIQVFLNNNVKYYLETNGEYIDNPHNPASKGVISVYDGYKKRFMFTNQDEDNSFTLSYSFIANKFRSFHSYKPNVFVSNDNRFFAIDNTQPLIKLFEHNKGEFLSFYGYNRSNFEVEFVVSSQGMSSIPDNLQIKSYCFNELDNSYVHQRTFDYIQAYNKKQNTSLIRVVADNSFSRKVDKNEIKAIEKNDSYNLALPKDLVINDSLDINEPTNLVSNLPFSDPRWLFRQRIRGNYTNVKLIYNPDESENYLFQLNFVAVKDRNNNFQ